MICQSDGKVDIGDFSQHWSASEETLRVELLKVGESFEMVTPSQA